MRYCDHGDDTYRYGNITMNFSSNIYAHADISELQNYLRERMGCISSYPEPEPLTLERLIAERENVGEECVMVGNGATELIYILAEMMQGKTYKVYYPTFSEYEKACRIHGMLMPYRSFMHDMEWICNPNNPDGRVWEKANLLHHIDAHRDTLFVIDASYEDYTLASLPSTDDYLARKNVVVLHSMTKKYCVPGLRLGYAVAQPQLIERMKALQQPWSVNAMAQEAGCFILRNSLSFLPEMNGYLDEAHRLAGAINELSGYNAEMKDTHFFLCTSERKARELKEILANRHGILIRDAGNFPELTPYHFRIAAQSKEENDRLTEVLRSL